MHKPEEQSGSAWFCNTATWLNVRLNMWIVFNMNTIFCLKVKLLGIRISFKESCDFLDGSHGSYYLLVDDFQF